MKRQMRICVALLMGLALTMVTASAAHAATFEDCADSSVVELISSTVVATDGICIVSCNGYLTESAIMDNTTRGEGGTIKTPADMPNGDFYAYDYRVPVQRSDSITTGPSTPYWDLKLTKMRRDPAVTAPVALGTLVATLDIESRVNEQSLGTDTPKADGNLYHTYYSRRWKVSQQLPSALPVVCSQGCTHPLLG